MNHVSSRIISAMLLTILLAVGAHQYAVKLGQMDRAAYLAQQAQRYDRQHAHPDSLVVQIFVCGFLVGGAVVAYEVLAFGAFKLLNKTAPDTPSTDSRTSPGNNGAP
jgi:hypothetical protein